MHKTVKEEFEDTKRVELNTFFFIFSNAVYIRYGYLLFKSIATFKSFQENGIKTSWTCHIWNL